MFDFENVTTNEGSKYLSYGENHIKVKSVEVKELTGNWSGTVADVIFEGVTGGTNTLRIFPPKPGKEAKFASNIKHLFNKALTEENFLKAVKGTTNFTDLMNGIGKEISASGRDFYILLIDDKGYPKVPFTFYSGGFASLEKGVLAAAYDPAKHGKKSAPANTEIPAASSDLMNMFAQTVSPVSSSSPAAIAVQEDDDLPF
jgi:hypothetical protein